jgi:Ni/Co efflux regulator RcnB
MRKLLISLLLAGAAVTPAIAGPNDSDRQQAREDRQQAHEERQQARSEARAERQQAQPQRSAPQGNVNRPQPMAVPQQAFSGGGGMRADARADRGNFGGGDRSVRFDARPDRGNRDAQGQVSAYVAPGPRVVTPRGVRVQDRGQFRQERIDARELRQSNRPLPNVMRPRNPPIVSNVPRPGTQPPLMADNHHVSRPQWSTNWRHDGRYDWRNYRNHHRSHFHLGFYFDPYGWGYQPFSIGWRLWPNYYQSNYWINDPWMYRLPYAPPGYRWIRYWNDALLVDTWTGEVVDAIPGFFW